MNDVNSKWSTEALKGYELFKQILRELSFSIKPFSTDGETDETVWLCANISSSNNTVVHYYDKGSALQHTI